MVFVFHVQVQRRSFSGVYLVEIQNTLIKESLVRAPFQLLLDFFQNFCCSLLLTTIHQYVGNMLQVVTFPNFPTCKKYLGLGIPLVGRPALFLLNLPPPACPALLAIYCYVLFFIFNYNSSGYDDDGDDDDDDDDGYMIWSTSLFWDTALPCLYFFGMYRNITKNCTVSEIDPDFVEPTTMRPRWGREIPDSLRIIIEGQGRDQISLTIAESKPGRFVSEFVGCWWFFVPKRSQILGYVIYQCPKRHIAWYPKAYVGKRVNGKTRVVPCVNRAFSRFWAVGRDECYCGPCTFTRWFAPGTFAGPVGEQAQGSYGEVFVRSAGKHLVCLEQEKSLWQIPFALLLEITTWTSRLSTQTLRSSWWWSYWSWRWRRKYFRETNYYQL